MTDGAQDGDDDDVDQYCCGDGCSVDDVDVSYWMSKSNWCESSVDYDVMKDSDCNHNGNDHDVGNGNVIDDWNDGNRGRRLSCGGAR